MCDEAARARLALRAVALRLTQRGLSQAWASWSQWSVACTMRMHAMRRGTRRMLNASLATAWDRWATTLHELAVLRASCRRMANARLVRMMVSWRTFCMEAKIFLRGLRMGASFLVSIVGTPSSCCVCVVSCVW